jgi:hypothetical protein
VAHSLFFASHPRCSLVPEAVSHRGRIYTVVLGRVPRNRKHLEARGSERQRLFAVHQKEQHEKKLERLLNALAMKEQLPYREPLAFGLRDLAEATDLSVAYLRQEIYQGRLVARKAGSRLLVRIEDAREWLYKLPLARPDIAP